MKLGDFGRDVRLAGLQLPPGTGTRLSEAMPGVGRVSDRVCCEIVNIY